jgi:hypothetical protein
MLVILGFFEVSLHILRNLDALGVHLYGMEKAFDFWPQWLLPNLLFWFSFGIVFGLHRQEILPWLERNKWLFLLGMIGMVPLTLVEYGLVRQILGKEWLGIHFRSLSTFLFALFFLFTFLAFHEFAFPFPKLFSNLGARSLGVYLAHYPALFLVGAIMYRYLPWMLGRQLVYLIVLIAAGLGIPILLMQVTSKPPLRRVYRYIFG